MRSPDRSIDYSFSQLSDADTAERIEQHLAENFEIEFARAKRCQLTPRDAEEAGEKVRRYYDVDTLPTHIRIL